MNHVANKDFKFVYYIRAFASLSVAVAHVYGVKIAAFHDNTDSTILKILLEFIYTGGFGVCWFFILSGFIIPISYTNLKTFIIRRVFRIYPVFLFACLISYFIGLYEFSWQYLLSFSLVFADIFNAPKPLTGVEWTLRIEVLFYIYLAILMYKNKLTTINIQYTSLLVLITLLFVKFFALAARPLPLLYFNLLLIGVVFYLDHFQLIKKTDFINTILIQLVIFSVIFMFFEINPYRNLLYPFLAIGTFYLFLKCESYFKVYPVVKLLSNCSYSLYLLHNMVFKVMLINFKIYMPSTIAYISSWTILILMCVLIYFTIESRFILLGRSLTKSASAKSVRDEKFHQEIIL